MTRDDPRLGHRWKNLNFQARQRQRHCLSPPVALSPSLHLTHLFTMAPINRAVTSAARAWTRHTLPTARPSSVAIPKAFSTNETRQADAGSIPSKGPGSEISGAYAPNTASTSKTNSTFDSPFHRSGGTMRDTHDIPSFGHYKSGRDEVTNRVFQYFMVGTFGAITAMGAKATVQGELRHY